MNPGKTPTVEVQMLIRKPVSVVFQAMIDPAITSRFWFSRSTGSLEAGKTITWTWDMYGISTVVTVGEVIENKKVSFQWRNPATWVDVEFVALKEDQTYVVIKNYGFHESGEALIEVIKDSTGGFTTVLDSMKTFLEFGIQLNLVADKYPKGVVQHGPSTD
jgi:uncharacterized protein YndB with AHSA1/START domain